MFGILKYIVKNNSGLAILKYLMFGFLFQIFKRIIKSIISREIFNGKRLFMYPNCNVASMYAYSDIPDKDEIEILRDLVKMEGGCIYGYMSKYRFI